MVQGSSFYSLYYVWYCHVSCQLSCHMLSRVQDLRTASHTLPEQCYYPFLISAAGRHTGRCLHNPRQPSNKLSLVPGMYLDSVDISRYHGWLSPGYLSPASAAQCAYCLVTGPHKCWSICPTSVPCVTTRGGPSTLYYRALLLAAIISIR